MNYIEYLINEKDVPHFSSDFCDSVILDYCVNNGPEKSLSICMEECAELIDVISEYQITGRLDKVHLTEEIVDCMISISMLEFLLHMKSKGTDYNIISKHENRDISPNICIRNLSNAIINISKIIRNKSDSEKTIYKTTDLIAESVENILLYFNIDTSDDGDHIDMIKKIFMFKIQRMKERNIEHEKEMKQSETVE